MKIEDQVCPFPLAIRLKELGVVQNSYFGWFNSDCEKILFPMDRKNSPWPQGAFEASAFTVAELGHMISATCNEWAQGYMDIYSEYHFERGNRGAGFFDGSGYMFISNICGFVENDDGSLHDEEAQEAIARAQFLIRMIENKECDINDINKSLEDK